MSTVEIIVTSEAQLLPSSDQLTVGLARQWNGLTHYRRRDL